MAKIVDLGLHDAMEAGQLDAAPPVDNPHIRFLQLIAKSRCDRRLGLRATCFLRILRIDGRSFEEIGAEFGVCRAAVQTIHREIQREHPELRGRADKDDSAREACKQRRTGWRKPHIDWPTSSIWRQPLPV